MFTLAFDLLYYCVLSPHSHFCARTLIRIIPLLRRQYPRQTHELDVSERRAVLAVGERVRLAAGADAAMRARLQVYGTWCMVYMVHGTVDPPLQW